MRKAKIPDVVVRRLPLYLRAVEDFDRREHVIVSSKELGDFTGLTSAQVRKDLTLFGEFGKQGIGYDVKFLRTQLRDILRLSTDVHIGLVGFGNLGQALVHYHVDARSRPRTRFSVSPDRLRIVAAFDVDPDKIGRVYAGVPIFHIDELAEKAQEYGLKIMVNAVPAEHAQEVVDHAVRAGIRAILNFAPVTLTVPDTVKLHSADLTLELQSLAYYAE
ncbi:MAG: redox-sensing transcriptional repressor Rex [Bacillota bacterium]|jgi:redox-sensing transcriptional repressor